MPPDHRPASGHRSMPRRQLSSGECRDWLRTHREGRLAYPTGRGPRSVVVCYAVTEDHVVFRLPDYNDIVHYAPGEHVTLEVEGAPEGTKASSRSNETVRVSGQAQLATAHSGRSMTDDRFPEQWPPSVSTRVIWLPLTEVEGYEVGADARP
jgi:nitroimidazol reductase NimA-like FMN-containing flavoprotein (pyridoxamine 5'-phosphate oxidase superfamily)